MAEKSDYIKSDSAKLDYVKLDYKKIGLKAGLEIHQQLDTRKLFCDCPSEIRDDAPDKTIKRFLRASAGETGDVDVAASAEMEKQKYFIYEYYDDSTCLVELDESPPHTINNAALDVALQFSIMTGCTIVDQVHVMRKTVVDGSNTSGFQRTALVARNGVMDVELSGSANDGASLKINVDTVCIEEDAAKIVKKEKDYDIYRLDRLGIPLIEIATGPDMRTSMEVKTVAAHIGMLLRSTGKVKRGLGTIRQDVNVSIAGGSRTEIKGVQDLKLIDTVVEFEALRQLNMLQLCEEMKIKGIAADCTKGEAHDFTDEFKNLQKGFIKSGIDSGLKIYGKSYKLFKGFFGYDVNPNRRYGTELSDRIKVLGLNGLIHTDENLEKYGIDEIVLHIYHELNLGSEDGMIFILGSQEKCILAFKKIDEAIIYFLESGLSKEVRNAKEDGTSQFMRPMPGGNRMYPETDIPIIYPDISRIQKPELIKDKTERLAREYELPKQVAKELVFEPDFEMLVKKYPQIKTITIAETLVTYPTEIKTLYNKDIDVSLYADTLLYNANIGNITSSAIKSSLIDIANGATIDEALAKYKPANEDEVISFITKTISEKINMNSNAIMGLVMKEYRGKFSGQRILELIKKFKGE